MTADHGTRTSARQEQHRAKMDNRRRGKGSAGLGRPLGGPLGNQRHDDELQADQAPAAEPTMT